ncbi:dihydrofolate reductase family protein [Patescibacteria group bacterium]|nr:dihydrofolate reductase family protein [Patescibacteria group bacterium]MDE1946424.1 dihydrofolate reductase [Patescibacteria group bacterium]MDE2011033.1 dihydrofolate reductase [Patescibacteria group bacterium]MDE2233623.1 dihydrofolate reductase [Patescibacteria group bacterium]
MLKTFIVAALSADGYIARDERHPAFWTSKEDKKRFVKLTRRAGVVVMGANTFTTIARPLKERVNIVYSRSRSFEGAEMTQDSPLDLLAKLEARGFKEAAICGGSHIYTMFMKADVVDRLYLTVEPIIFGAGIRLFNEPLDNYHLELLSLNKAGNGAILLEYKVDYSGSPKSELEVK